MGAHKCVSCNREFVSSDSLTQHNSSKHNLIVKPKRSYRKLLIFSLVFLIFFFSVMVFFRGSNSPGVLDGFATCLSGKGVIVYGNDFCSYTSKQLNLFGKSKGLLNYIRCIDDEGLCDSKGIKITPTWEIDDRLYSGVKGLDVISELSGCIL